MRQQDTQIFKDAAVQNTVWILVRDTNKASLDYLSEAEAGKNYYPKPMDCKPKTADLDAGGRRHRGLVVDPEVSPGSFSPPKLEKTLKEWIGWPWQDYLNAADKSQPKRVDPKSIHGKAEEPFYYKVDLDLASPHYGCLMRGTDPRRMCYLFGDYDLKDIVDPSHPAGNLAAIEKKNGQLSMRGPKFYAVQKYINQRLGVPMIQHGGDAQARPHDDEVIHVFSPEGKYTKLTSKRDQEWFYEGLSVFGFKLSRVAWLDRIQRKLGFNQFQGRRTLNGKLIKEGLEAHDRWVEDFQGNPPSTYKPWTPEVIKGGKN